ncbi:hypothetical protein RR48_10530 [Papilio machaon]|uniref:Uncharacterized protein n=1 Tax=Papilio machaon TaxID=76193 RepID=A0A194R6N3_PAPMA|nr:hypothetical protein RR48_10530 [Papilio machaon]
MVKVDAVRCGRRGGHAAARAAAADGLTHKRVRPSHQLVESLKMSNAGVNVQAKHARYAACAARCMTNTGTFTFDRSSTLEFEQRIFSNVPWEGIKLGGESRRLVQRLCTTGLAGPRPAASPRFIIQVNRLSDVTIIGFIGMSRGVPI